MTDTAVAGVSAPPEAALERAIAECHPAPLLMSLVHVTGDTGLLDEFGARLTLWEPGNHYRTGTRPVVAPGTSRDDVSADIRARARAVLTPAAVATLEVPDAELFRRLAAICSALRVAAEVVPLLLEQSGFVEARRHVPGT